MQKHTFPSVSLVKMTAYALILSAALQCRSKIIHHLLPSSSRNTALHHIGRDKFVLNANGVLVITSDIFVAGPFSCEESMKKEGGLELNPYMQTKQQN